MPAWSLPETLEVGGTEYGIRTDFRAVLDILAAFNDPELPEAGKLQVMVEILYFLPPPPDHLEEAIKKANWFIDCGEEHNTKPGPRTMDWEQDAPIIFPAIEIHINPCIGGLLWDISGKLMEDCFRRFWQSGKKESKGKN